MGFVGDTMEKKNSKWGRRKKKKKKKREIELRQSPSSVITTFTIFPNGFISIEENFNFLSLLFSLSELPLSLIVTYYPWHYPHILSLTSPSFIFQLSNNDPTASSPLFYIIIQMRICFYVCKLGLLNNDTHINWPIVISILGILYFVWKYF